MTITNCKILISISWYQLSQRTENIKQHHLSLYLSLSPSLSLLPNEEAAAEASTEMMAALMNEYESCVRPGKITVHFFCIF